MLAPLRGADVLLVAALPAVSEELLFRGALIPAIYPDWWVGGGGGGGGGTLTGPLLRSPSPPLLSLVVP